jgi:hypothetical protein
MPLAVRSQFLSKLTELTVSGLKRTPFCKHKATLRANHQVHQFAVRVGSEREIGWFFASRTNEN